jgi:hypothetical protein
MSSSSGIKSWSRHQDIDQRFVITPYGKGIVVATRISQQQRKCSDDSSIVGDEKDCLQNRNELLAAIEWTARNSQITVDKPTCNSPSVVMQVVELLDWDISSSSSAASKFPKLYTSSFLPSVPPMVGDDVICTYGRGTVVQLPTASSSITATEYTSSQTHIVVHIKSWRLNDRNKVICYLLPQHVHVVRKKTLHEMDVYEKVEQANQFKQDANACFSNQQYEQALVKYEKAIDTVRYVQHDTDSNNYVRADLVEIMITCSNNAATSCLKLLQAAATATADAKRSSKETNNYYKELILKNARNALVLIEALYDKRGQKIHMILSKKYSDIKIFGEWRCKSLALIAKIYSLKKEYSEVVAICHQISKIMLELTPELDGPQTTATLARQLKESQRLLATSLQQLKLEKQKEKKRAQAMFGSPSPSKSKKANAMTGTMEDEYFDDDDDHPQDYVGKPKKKIHATNGIANVGGKHLKKSHDDVKTRTTRGKRTTQGVSKPSSYSVSNKQRRVSFHETVLDNNKDNNNTEETILVDDDWEEEEEDGYNYEEESWIHTNKEALIVGAVASLIALSCLLLIRTSRRK